MLKSDTLTLDRVTGEKTALVIRVISDTDVNFESIWATQWVQKPHATVEDVINRKVLGTVQK